MTEVMLDVAGRRRLPATLPGFGAGRPPRNKGRRYPADPPTIEEIVAVMRHAGDGIHGRRLRGLIVVLWRAGLRIHEALASVRPILTVAGDRFWCGEARAAADARSEWTSGLGNNSDRGLTTARSSESGRCSASSPDRHADAWSNTAVRAQLRHVAAQAGVRSRFAPHQLRHAHAVEMAREACR